MTKLNQDISEIQLQASIINTLSNVRNAYWDYVFAIQAVDVARESLDLASKLVQDNQTRVEVGTMAPIDVVQAQSRAGDARQTLVHAEATRRTTELALKRLIVAGTQDPNWDASIDPTDRPTSAEADRRRGGRPPRAQRTHRPDDREEEPRSERRHAETTCTTRCCRRRTSSRATASSVAAARSSPAAARASASASR